MDNLKSTDYDVSEVKTGKRFEQCKKDMLLVDSVFFIVLFIGTIIAYTLSPGDASQLTYLFGFPLWYAVTWALYVGLAIFGIVFALKTKKFSLAPRADDTEVDY